MKNEPFSRHLEKFDACVKDGSLSPIESKTEREKIAKQCLKNAEDDMQAARRNFESESFHWTIVIGYNAVVETIDAVLAHKGLKVESLYARLCAVAKIFGKDMFYTFWDLHGEMRDAKYYREKVIGKSHSKEFLEKIPKIMEKFRKFIE